MNLRFGHVCDYATIGNNGKLIIVGVFDTVIARLRDDEGNVRLPLCYLVFRLECSIAEGAQHQVMIRIVDEDGNEVAPMAGVGTRFRPHAPGRPLSANGIINLQIGVPREGDYMFEIHVDGAVIGEIPFYVVPVPPAPERPDAK